jgi:hypothetical protein
MTEMLVALFLASVGLISVFGMQVAASLVQRQARDINAARMLGESFLSRLRGETVNWTSDLTVDCNGTGVLPLCDYARVTRGAGTWGTWVAAPNALGTTSPTFNALGYPNDPADTRLASTPASLQRGQRYCLHYALQPVAVAMSGGALLRAQVRVFWPMADDALAAPSAGGFGDCGFGREDQMVTAAESLGTFRYVQLNAVLYRHQPSF